jgi:hypothetical protein
LAAVIAFLRDHGAVKTGSKSYLVRGTVAARFDAVEPILVARHEVGAHVVNLPVGTVACFDSSSRTPFIINGHGLRTLTAGARETEASVLDSRMKLAIVALSWM